VLGSLSGVAKTFGKSGGDIEATEVVHRFHAGNGQWHKR
jgi:hypothetical protein